jgi:hypothetical protein
MLKIEYNNITCPLETPTRGRKSNTHHTYYDRMVALNGPDITDNAWELITGRISILRPRHANSS